MRSCVSSSNRPFSCYVIAAMLEDDNKRFLITSIVSSTNMAATSFSLDSRDCLQTINIRLNSWNLFFSFWWFFFFPVRNPEKSRALIGCCRVDAEFVEYSRYYNFHCKTNNHSAEMCRSFVDIFLFAAVANSLRRAARHRGSYIEMDATDKRQTIHIDCSVTTTHAQKHVNK